MPEVLVETASDFFLREIANGDLIQRRLDAMQSRNRFGMRQRTAYVTLVIIRQARALPHGGMRSQGADRNEKATDGHSPHQQ